MPKDESRYIEGGSLRWKGVRATLEDYTRTSYVDESGPFAKLLERFPDLRSAALKILFAVQNHLIILFVHFIMFSSLWWFHERMFLLFPFDYSSQYLHTQSMF